ncbi:hypothetical protein ES705_08181 [subsurface metagenome]|jgi:hypothetical protein
MRQESQEELTKFFKAIFEGEESGTRIYFMG